MGEKFVSTTINNLEYSEKIVEFLERYVRSPVPSSYRRGEENKIRKNNETKLITKTSNLNFKNPFRTFIQAAPPIPNKIFRTRP